VPLGKAGEYPVRSCCSRGIRRRTVFRSPSGKRSTRPYESSNERESAWRARKGRRRHQARSRGIRRRERSEDPREKGQALGRSTRKEKELQGPEAKTTRKREIVTYGPNHARKRSCSGVGAARSSRSPSTQEGTIRGTIVNHARKRVRARKEHERQRNSSTKKERTETLLRFPWPERRRLVLVCYGMVLRRLRWEGSVQWLRSLGA
jgi:hypothetical protein